LNKFFNLQLSCVISEHVTYRIYSIVNGGL